MGQAIIEAVVFISPSCTWCAEFLFCRSYSQELEVGTKGSLTWGLVVVTDLWSEQWMRASVHRTGRRARASELLFSLAFSDILDKWTSNPSPLDQREPSAPSPLPSDSDQRGVVTLFCCLLYTPGVCKTQPQFKWWTYRGLLDWQSVGRTRERERTRTIDSNDKMRTI